MKDFLKVITIPQSLKFSAIKESLRGHTKLLLYNLLFILLMGGVFTHFLVVDYSNGVQRDALVNMEEFIEPELEFLCALNECKYIYHKETWFGDIHPKYTLLQEADYELPKTIYKFDDKTYLLSTLDIRIDIRAFDSKMIVPFDNIHSAVGQFGHWGIFLFLLFNVYLVATEFRQRNINKFKEIVQNETSVYNQSLMILSENLHHELNTPLTVITGKITKIKRMIEDECEANSAILFANGEGALCNDFKSIYEKDFKILKSSLTQVTDILNKMKKFKYLKSSNNERNLYEVIQSTVDILLVSQAEKIECDIDEKFKQFHADPEHIRNGVITGIILNFIKNSVEHGHATSIRFSMGEIWNDRISFFIGDNGNGIKEKDVPNVFREDYSTSEEEKRGNGLFINKFLLESGDGSVSLMRTSKVGTIFKITIRIKGNDDAQNDIHHVVSTDPVQGS